MHRVHGQLQLHMGFGVNEQRRRIFYWKVHSRPPHSKLYPPPDAHRHLESTSTTARSPQCIARGSKKYRSGVGSWHGPNSYRHPLATHWNGWTEQEGFKTLVNPNAICLYKLDIFGCVLGTKWLASRIRIHIHGKTMYLLLVVVLTIKSIPLEETNWGLIT